MRRYVVYHNVAKMGEDPEPLSAETNKPFAKNVIGETVWIIAGSGSKPRKYALASTFVVNEISEQDGRDFQYKVSGPDGKVFRPPILLNELSWFREFLRDQQNFRRGLREITEPRVIEELQRLACRV